MNRMVVGKFLQWLLMVAAMSAMIIAASVQPASATVGPDNPSYGLDGPQACDWEYKNHAWPSSSDQRVIYARGGAYNHYYEAWVSHEIQTAVDQNNSCPNRIRTATDMTCYYRTTEFGPRNLSSCGGWTYVRLAINVGGADYDRIEEAERYSYFFTNIGTTTRYSDWVNWYNECYLPMVEVDRMDFHGESWYLSGAANYYPIGCKVPYHP